MRCSSFLLILLIAWVAIAIDASGEDAKPVWLMGNNFHTSLVFRAKDVPFCHEISGAPEADELAIGWGAEKDYRGPSNLWTIIQAIFPNRGALHVVPIHGLITRRFSHSDLVRLKLPPGAYAQLMAEGDRSVALATDHRRVFLGKGFYPDSRFYLSSEHFYFPYVCNTWVAIKLNRAAHTGLFLPTAVLSANLIHQAAMKGVMFQHYRSPGDGY